MTCSCCCLCFSLVLCVWWSEYCRLYPIPATWAALKTAMCTHWVPPYYQRELLQKLPELQIGMIRCGIVEENEPMLARFMGGLNRENHTILEYKEYTNITCLFHLACKAECEVQDRQALARTNFSAGRSSSWTPRASSDLMRGIPRPSPWTPPQLSKLQVDQ